MPYSAETLTNVTGYSGNLQIRTGDGNHLPITTAMVIDNIFNNVFVSLSLISHLIFVGQLVNNDCQIEFSKFCFLVHHQQSCKDVHEGPEVVHLFPLHVSVYVFLPAFYFL